MEMVAVQMVGLDSCACCWDTYSEKKVCITYIYVGMFLLQGLFTFPDEHDKTVYQY